MPSVKTGEKRTYMSFWNCFKWKKTNNEQLPSPKLQDKREKCAEREGMDREFGNVVSSMRR